MTSLYIYDRQGELLGWAEQRIPGQRFRGDATAIGHERNGSIVGVAVFDTFSPTDCCFSLASDGSRRWLTREFGIRAMAYPFVQCGFRRITALISERNASSIRFARHYGWCEEGVLREGGAEGENVLVFGLLRRECRWLPPLMRAGIGAPGSV